MRTRYFLDTWHDNSAEDPSSWTDWHVYSFARWHANYRDPGTLELDKLGKRRAVGTAFFLSYHEHGLCVWSLNRDGPRCQWDTVDGAGLLVWEGRPEDIGPDPDARRHAAKGFLRTYTNWCNGHVYGFTLRQRDETADGFTRETSLESCGGYYGDDPEGAGFALLDMLPEGVSARDVETGNDDTGTADVAIEFARGCRPCVTDGCRYVVPADAGTDYCAACIMADVS